MKSLKVVEKYPSSILLQGLFTSRKPIHPMPSSKSSISSKIVTSKCDISILTRPKCDNSRLDPPQTARRRYNSLASIPPITATSWCIMEATSSHWISGNNDTEIREVASLTKIMTCILCLNSLKSTSTSLDTLIKVSYKASKTTGTTANLRSGDRLSIKDLLYGLMLPSGNDAAWVLAEYFGTKFSPNSVKPVKHFTAEMNRLGRDLNLIATNFENPHGLMYKKNLSNARDIAKIACYALRDEIFKMVVDTKRYVAEIKGADGVFRKEVWENTNKLLGNGFCGVKTGVTDGAGPCLCVTIRKQNPIVIVLLNSRSMDDRWVEARRLSEWMSLRYI